MFERPPVPHRNWSYSGCAILFTSLLLAACASVPQHAGAPQADWRPSPNFDARRANYVILHHTSNDNVADALATLTSPLMGVSSHYLIARDGAVLQLVDETRRAWHAGASWWGGQTDMNSASIGIELDNTGDEAYPDIQIDALIALLTDVTTRHNIPRTHVLAHADIAPGRKSDPSALFPWNRLAAAGFGLWCAEPEPAAAPENFDARLALSALGYDPRQPEAALNAFRLHFMGNANTETPDPNPNPAEAALIQCLLRSSSIRGASIK